MDIQVLYYKVNKGGGCMWNLKHSFMKAVKSNSDLKQKLIEFEQSAEKIIKEKLAAIEDEKRSKFEARKAKEEKEREERSIINRSKTLWVYCVKSGEYWFSHGIVWSNDINEAYSIVMQMYPDAVKYTINPVDCSRVSFEICEYYK